MLFYAATDTEVRRRALGQNDTRPKGFRKSVLKCHDMYANIIGCRGLYTEESKNLQKKPPIYKVAFAKACNLDIL